jgi:hypothetical protein
LPSTAASSAERSSGLGQQGHAQRAISSADGRSRARTGDLERARELQHDGVAAWREAGADFRFRTALHGLGDIELDAGCLADARSAYEEALRIARAEGAVRVMCSASAARGRCGR